MPPLDNDALKAACFSLAQALKWEKGPVDVDAISALADELAGIAKDSVDFLEQQRRDPNIVTRAVRYIENHHGGPWGGRDWFYATFETLIELACPNTGSSSSDALFYKDIEEGIAEARADFA